MKRKKFKIYVGTHASVTVFTEVTKVRRRQGRIFGILLFFPRAIGRTFMRAVRAYQREVRRTIDHGLLRAKKLAAPGIAWGFGFFLLLAAAGFGGFKVLSLAADALELKDSVYLGAQNGIEHLTQAEQALVSQDLEAAHTEFSMAFERFSGARSQISEGNRVVGEILNLLPQKKGAQAILDAAASISQAGNALTEFYSTAQSLGFSAEGLESASGVPETLESLQKSLATAASRLDQGKERLSSVKAESIPASRREEFITLREKLAQSSAAVNNFSDIFSLFNALMLPKRNVLVFFENNNELRAGGGFMGTYGSFTLDAGKIRKLTISSVYDLDGQLTDVIAPPPQLLPVNDRWYLRDSNWFADFGQSAKKISSFYEKEGGETPDLIVAMTPTVIVELLKLTGPVAVPTFGTSLDAENFVERTQAVSTVSYAIPINSPKQILADFFPIFLQKLSAMPRDRYGEMLSVLERSLSSKQLVLHSREASLSQELENFHWSGTISESDRDYLSIISSNLGGTKTDLSLRKYASLTTTVGKDGQLTDELIIEISNPLPDMPGSENSSFLRVLTPPGSTLLSASGFEKRDLSLDPERQYKTDPDIQSWQGSIVVDPASGTMVGTESGKTFFGNWITVRGGERKTIRLAYRLPYRLKSADRLSLVVQKQIGSVSEQLSYTVNFPEKELKWLSFVPSDSRTRSTHISTPLNSDLFFGLILKDR